MVGAPGREIAAVEEDRDKFSCNEEGDGHDKQCEVPSKHQAASSIWSGPLWVPLCSGRAGRGLWGCSVGRADRPGLLPTADRSAAFSARTTYLGALP